MCNLCTGVIWVLGIARVRQERGRASVLEGLPKPGQSFHRIVVVGGARLETEFEIEPVGGGHGRRRGIEIDGRALRGGGSVQDCLGECAAECKPPCGGADPEALEFPCVRGDSGWKCAPRNKPGGLDFNAGNEATAALFEVALRQERSLSLEGSEAEAGCSGLGNNKPPVFKQKLARLDECFFC